MCGICGNFYFNPSERVDAGTIAGMCEAIVHRGPDDQGVYADQNIGLGARRLSIIDLEGGHQPVHSEDSSKWVVQNGEIYNFRELRDTLKQKGHEFYTKSDTEVILHAYEEYGERCVERFEGMFAFAIWDADKEQLFLGRDRMGKKPLHYMVLNDQFMFSSEIKSILRHPDFRKEIEDEQVKSYLLYGYIPAPDSIFKGIKKLPPAHTLTITGSADIKIRNYWNMDFRSKIAEHDEEKIIDMITFCLKESVRKRLVSDVPLGVFLSGGVDSSLVLAMMCELLPPEDISAFSIGFEEAEYDESGYAKAVADRLGVNHRLEMLPLGKVLKNLPRIIQMLDEPIADPSIVPTYMLSDFTRKYVTVALSGDGGDELFGGYPKYYAHKFSNFYDSLFPALIRRNVDKVLYRSRDITEKILNDKIKRFLIGLSYSPDIRNHAWISPFFPREIESLLTEEAKNSLSNGYFGEVEEHAATFIGEEPLDKMIYLDTKLTLADLYLVKVDRASMACSLEVRSPFLDRQMVELAASIPSKLKVKGATTKYILKRVAERYLPERIIYRKKMGFGMPLSNWLRRELTPLIHENLSEDRIKNEGFFNYPVIEGLLNEHFEGKKDNSFRIWNLLVFQIWLNRWGAGIG
ncbi:MAG: asparagine synthase (glutamine-hydrolyzing) [Candidatus Methanoperedens sp.]|nr:asparagine synthase (glutamine-hydrolyzing) [Candidatus Methanoperedens sp.]